jgi:hypothetical protein
MIVREYQCGDAQNIISLLSSNTTQIRDSDFWLWINRIWPEQESIVVVAEDDGVVVAHYAILPSSVQISGKIIPSGLGVHALVDPAARGRIPIYQITKRCYQIAKERGLKLLYGFPNKNFRLIQEKVEGWHCVNQFNAYLKTPALSDGLGLSLHTLPFDERDLRISLHDLIERYRDESRYTVLPSFQRWIKRFTMHPQTSYGFHMLRQGSMDLGLLVSRIFTDVNGCSEGQIVDMVVSRNLEQRSVIAAFENYCKPIIDKVCLWPLNQEFEEALISSGYTQTGFDTFFAIKVLDESILIEHPSIKQIGMWRLPMAMSDVF